MSASAYLWSLAAQGIYLRVEGNRLTYEAIGIQLSDDHRAAISARRSELLACLREGDHPSAFLPVTDLQAAYLRPFGDDNSPYWAVNMVAYRLTDRLDVGAVRRAVAVLLDRHEVLRSTFRAVDGAFACGVWSSLIFDPLVIEDRQESISDLDALFDANTTFDPFTGPLWRLRLVQEPRCSILVLEMHRAISDGWSIRLMTEELLMLAQGIDASMLESPGDYVDWASRHQLSSAIPSIVDGRRLDSGSAAVRRCQASFTVTDVTTVARRLRQTVFCVVAGVFASAAAEVERRSCLTVAVPASLRTTTSDETIVGHMVMSVATNFDLSPRRPERLRQAIDRAAVLTDPSCRQASGEDLHYYLNFLAFQRGGIDNLSVNVDRAEIVGTRGAFRLKLYAWFEDEVVWLKFVYDQNYYCPPDTVDSIAATMESSMEMLLAELTEGVS